MNIIVVGCGKIGNTIIASLVSEGHNVVAVDDDPAALSETTNIYDVIGVCGDCTNCDTLADAGAEKADLFLSITGSDELNMLSCFLAKRMGAAHTIPRIRNPKFQNKNLEFLRQHLAFSFCINPDKLAAQELFNILKLPSAVKIESFASGSFEMIELRLKPDSILNGVRLSELRQKYQAKVLICAVQREGVLYIPDGSFILQSGDKIGLTATPMEIQKFLKKLGLLQRQAKHVILLGASRIAYYLAKFLIKSNSTVKIVEQNPDRCKLFSQLLPEALIIQGDGAQQELLLEEGLQSTDAFISLTGMDEENILISYFAMLQNVPKVITKVNRSEFISLAEKLELDCIISPRHIVSDVLVQYARALENSLGSNVETLYHLMDGNAEALAFNVRNDFKATNLPLKDMALKPDILIAGIIRNRKTIIPGGDDMILPEDKVIVLAANQRLQDLSDILK